MAVLAGGSGAVARASLGGGGRSGYFGSRPWHSSCEGRSPKLVGCCDWWPPLPPGWPRGFTPGG